jgi:quercetin 2,3-dioxygenase
MSAVVQTVELGMQWPTLDPFLFCVHHVDHYPAANDRQGPAASLAGRTLGQDFEGVDGWRMYHGQIVPGFPAHPHRGFETVTYVRQGLIDHADSMGAAARYGRGDVQWLTAGSGIQHAEMFPLLDRDGPNTAELFQIWLNLPAADKMVEPHFAMLWNERIPRVRVQDDGGREIEIAVIAGTLAGHGGSPPPPSSWAARPEAHVAIWTLKLQAGARFTLPPAPQGVDRTIYFVRGGRLTVGTQTLERGQGARLRGDREAPISAEGEQTEALVLQGRPIGEPVVQHGPFVMNTPQEIQQAILDYRRTGFGGWPWKSDGPVHARSDGRFAIHADGRREDAG